MRNFYSFIAILLGHLVMGQVVDYKAQVVDEGHLSLPYVKLKYKNAVFNANAEGGFSGKMNIGDTITVVDYEFESIFHVIKKPVEKIVLAKKYTEISPVLLNVNKKYITEYHVKRSRKVANYGFPYKITFAFGYSTSDYIKFNTIEFPIKYVDTDKKLKLLSDKAKFTIQFFTADDGVPNEAISSLIYVNTARHLRSIKLRLPETLVIPKGQFFVVIKAVEEDGNVSDKSELMLNPYFLSNVDGPTGSWLWYDDKKGVFVERGTQLGDNYNINLIFNLSLQ